MQPSLTEIKVVVAVVDDDQRLLESLESLLESVGYIVRLFSSAEAFLESGILREVNCVISDIGMPGMSGFELRNYLELKRPELPVVFLTGRRNLASVQHAPDQRPQYLFEKPFDSQALLATVAAISQPSGIEKSGKQ
jgi:FixJ family two-component response regulator